MTKVPEEVLSTMDRLMQMMTEHRIDAVEFGEIKIVKTQHSQPEEVPTKDIPEEVDDELLFFSANS